MAVTTSAQKSLVLIQKETSNYWNFIVFLQIDTLLIIISEYLITLVLLRKLKRLNLTLKTIKFHV